LIKTTNGFAFEADVLMSTNNAVASASIQPPAPEPLQSLTNSGSATTLDLKHKYNTLSKLDQHYTNGTYTFTINGATDGTHQPGLLLFGNAYPNGPRLQNFTDLQSVNGYGYFQAFWDNFAGGTADDFIQLRIEDLAGNKLSRRPTMENRAPSMAPQRTRSSRRPRCPAGRPTLAGSPS